MKEKNGLKKGLFLTAALSSLPIAYYAYGAHLFNKYAKVDKSYVNLDMSELIGDERIYTAYKNDLKDNIDWFKSSHVQKIQVRSFDELILDGIKVVNHDKAPYMIMLHGYNSDRYILLKQAKAFDAMGFNLLMVDERAFGKSMGEYTTFGFKESLDLLVWIKALIKEDPEIKIGLYGVSMGATAIMKALGYQLPSNISFAIEDSGYASLSDLIKYRFKNDLLIPSINAKMKKTLGFDIAEIDVLEALKKNEIPILFIHAQNDEVVPLETLGKLYEANKGPKAFKVFSEGSHAYSCFEEGYFEVIKNFIDNYVK